jgi:hypothetical protein
MASNGCAARRSGAPSSFRPCRLSRNRAVQVKPTYLAHAGTFRGRSPFHAASQPLPPELLRWRPVVRVRKRWGKDKGAPESGDKESGKLLVLGEWGEAVPVHPFFRASCLRDTPSKHAVIPGAMRPGIQSQQVLSGGACVEVASHTQKYPSVTRRGAMDPGSHGARDDACVEVTLVCNQLPLETDDTR